MAAIPLKATLATILLFKNLRRVEEGPYIDI